VISEILLKMGLNNLAPTQFIVLGLIQLELEPMIYCIHGRHANHYTICLVISMLEMGLL
jgi:hypothetical protein